MAKRKNFVSDGLVTLRRKYREQHSGDSIVSTASDDTSFNLKPDIDKNLSIRERRTQIYHQAQNDLNLRLHEHLAVLEAEIATQKQNLTNYEAASKKFEQLLKKFADLPGATEFEENPEALTRLEQLRIEFFSTKASCARTTAKSSVNTVPAANPSRISLLPELNSLNQLQMLKMGLCFAFPLIIGIIAGCCIIAWVIIITWGV